VLRPSLLPSSLVCSCGSTNTLLHSISILPTLCLSCTATRNELHEYHKNTAKIYTLSTQIENWPTFAALHTQLTLYWNKLAMDTLFEQIFINLYYLTQTHTNSSNLTPTFIRTNYAGVGVHSKDSDRGLACVRRLHTHS
jgi:hypothetical protein